MDTSRGATESDAPTTAVVAGGGMVVVGLALAVLTTRSIAAALDELGAVDRRLEAVRFAGTLLGALLTGLGASTLLRAVLPTWHWGVQALVAVLIAATVIVVTLWLLVGRPDQEFEEGRLTAEAPFVHRALISGGNGYRYYVTIESSGSLKATLDVRGSGSPIPGVMQPDGRQIVAEGVLVGDTTWTAVIKYVEGDGKYLLFVDSAQPEQLVMSERALERGFDVGRSRAGYIFTLTQRTDVFIHAADLDDPSLDPGMLLRDSDGTPIDNVPVGGDGVIFTEMPAGNYVLELRGSPNQRFSLVFDDHDPGHPTEPPPEPVSEDVAVPDVSGQPELPAVQLLSEAGFVVQSYPVCSNSLAARGAAVGTTRQVVVSGAASSADEVEVVGSDGVTTATLPTGTAVDVKVFNGQPCDAG